MDGAAVAQSGAVSGSSEAEPMNEDDSAAGSLMEGAIVQSGEALEPDVSEDTDAYCAFISRLVGPRQQDRFAEQLVRYGSDDAARQAEMLRQLDVVLPGTAATLLGLQGRPEMNGCECRVLGRSKGGRFPVRAIFEGGSQPNESVLIRLRNLRPSAETKFREVRRRESVARSL
jgi:hypothetical protein